jgi:hypothetical protein
MAVLTSSSCCSLPRFDRLEGEAARDGLRHVRAADVDLAAETRFAAAQDVDRGARSAYVDERDGRFLAGFGLLGGQAAELPRVGQREEVDVDCDRRQALVLQDLHALLDRLRLARREQDRHLLGFLAALAVALGLALGIAFERLAIELHFVEIEGQVLVRLEPDRLLQVDVGHLHHRDVAHDDALPRDGGHDPSAPEFPGLEGLVHCVGETSTGRDLDVREARHDGLGAFESDLDGFHDRATHVEPDDTLLLAEHGTHTPVS